MKKLELVYNDETLAVDQATKYRNVGFSPKIVKHKTESGRPYYSVKFNITEREYNMMKCGWWSP